MVCRKEDMEDTPGIILLEIPADSDLLPRIEKLSEQTGLAPLDLLHKWVLQEESLIGFMQRSKNAAVAQTPNCPTAAPQEFSGVRGQAEAEKIDPNSPNYRKILVKRAKKLRRKGTTLAKIAEIFNEENFQTVSGKGKWYSSSIINLLSSK
jgi:hypothetical protein